MRILMLLLAFAGAAVGQAAVPLPKVSVNDLAFMKGCWAIERQERKTKIEEQWMAPAGGVMLGMSRSVRDGRTTGYEYMRLESNGDGLFFISKPKENKEETAFKLKTFSSGSVVFENPGHDFPQRVIYRSGGPDALNARIEGAQNGKASGIDFAYTRVKCD